MLLSGTSLEPAWPDLAGLGTFVVVKRPGTGDLQPGPDVGLSGLAGPAAARRFNRSLLTWSLCLSHLFLQSPGEADEEENRNREMKRSQLRIVSGLYQGLSMNSCPLVNIDI